MNINAGNLYRYAVKLIEGVEDVGTPQGLSSIIFATLSLEPFINEIPFFAAYRGFGAHDRSLDHNWIKNYLKS